MEEGLGVFGRLLGLEGWRTPAVYRHPAVVLSGDGSSSRLDEVLGDLPFGDRVLFVCDAQLVARGLITGVQESVERTGHGVDLYAGVTGEPSDQSLADAASFASTAGVGRYGMVVGVGGGSALDTAKLVSALLATKEPLQQLIARRTSGPAASTLMLVPTTAGTGAEVSPNAVLSVGDRKVVISGPALYAAIAVLDPLLTMSMPRGATVASGIDALCHCVETLMSTWATPMTALRSLEGARLMATSLPTVFNNPGDLPGRRAALYGSHIAGLSLSASTLLGHSLAYCVSTRTHLPHGIATGLSLCYCIAYNRAAARDRLAILEEVLNVPDTELIAWIWEFVRSLGIPTSLEEVGISQDDIPGMVRDTLEKYPRPNNPRELNEQDVSLLFQFALTGDIGGYLEATR